MMCEHCSARVIKALESMGASVKVDLQKKEVAVTGDISDADIKTAIEDLGFEVK